MTSVNIWPVLRTWLFPIWFSGSPDKVWKPYATINYLNFDDLWITLKLHEGLIIINYHIWPLLIFDLYEGHHQWSPDQVCSHGTYFTIFDPIWPLTSMNVISILNLRQQFFWPNTVAIALSLPFLTSDDFWPLLRSLLLKTCIKDFLTKFGRPNHSAQFTMFDLWWPLTSMKVIVNLHQAFFWPRLVTQYIAYHVWPLMTFNLNEDHHHNFHQGFLWPSLVVIEHCLMILTPGDPDPLSV